MKNKNIADTAHIKKRDDMFIITLFGGDETI